MRLQGYVWHYRLPWLGTRGVFAAGGPAAGQHGGQTSLIVQRQRIDPGPLNGLFVAKPKKLKKILFLFLINTCYYLLQSRLQLIWEIGSNTCYLLSWWQWGGRLWSKLRLTSTCPPSLVTVSPINKRPRTRPGLASYCHEPLTKCVDWYLNLQSCGSELKYAVSIFCKLGSGSCLDLSVCNSTKVNVKIKQIITTTEATIYKL